MLKRKFLFLSFLLILLLRTAEVCAQVAPPSGVIGWWAGDGDGRDMSGNGYNGSLLSATYALGRVGQAFSFDGMDDSVSIPAINIGSTFSLELWIYPTGSGSFQHLVSNSYTSANFGALYFNSISQRIEYWQGGTFHTNTVAGIPLNQWTHVALTYNGSIVQLYLNGAASGSPSAIHAEIFNNPLRFGYSVDAESSRFQGRLDEISLYNAALSALDIQSIYNAGVGGKIKSVATAAGANLQIQVGDHTLTFGNVSAAGITSSYSIDPGSAGTLPAGYTQTGLAYEISTTAVFNGNVLTCFHIPAVNDETVFGKLKILHSEGGTLVDKTTAFDFPTRVVCGRVTSLSPFVIANGLAPTAAEVSITGRVSTASGQGIRNARLTLISPDGAHRTATTNGFGYYAFGGVEVGRTYVLEIASKRYTFAEPTRIFKLQDELTGIDFTAWPQ